MKKGEAMKLVRWIALAAAALVLLAVAADLPAATTGEPAQIRVQWKLGEAGEWSAGAWSALYASEWDSLLSTGLTTAQAAGDTFFVRLKVRDAAGNESPWCTADDFPALAFCFQRMPAAPTLTVVDCYCVSDHDYLSVSSDVPAQFCYATRLATNAGCTSGGSWSAWSSWTSNWSTSFGMNGPMGTPLHYACIRIKARDSRGNESTTTLCGKYFDADAFCHD